MVRRPAGIVRLFASAIIMLAGLCPAASAQNAHSEKTDDAPKGLFERDTLIGDWRGFRTDLAALGIALNATEISDTFGVVSGGTHRGAVYDGRLELDLDLDLDQILGWDNTVLRASAYQIHGRDVSGNYLAANLLTVSDVAAIRATRLFDLWIQHGFLDNAVSLRVGQIAADDEFMTSEYAAGLINATFGWPAILSLALPSGGPAYPLATPGLRVKAALSTAVTLQFGLFDGDPSGAPQDVNPEQHDPSGTTFDFGNGAFLLAEASYAPGIEESGVAPATIYKIGAWYHSGRFGDLGATVPGTDTPIGHHGNFGVYAIADRLLYRPAGSEDLGLGAFLRVAAVPDDRNFIAFYADAGLAYRGVFAGRDNDVLSFGIAWASVSNGVSRVDAALQHSSGEAVPIPHYEAAIELTYQAVIAPCWSIQPDLQYIVNPTEAIVHPESPDDFTRVRSAVVVGLRTSIRF